MCVFMCLCFFFGCIATRARSSDACPTLQLRARGGGYAAVGPGGGRERVSLCVRACRARVHDVLLKNEVDLIWCDLSYNGV